jgi:hypothetical protein
MNIRITNPQDEPAIVAMAVAFRKHLERGVCAGSRILNFG